MKRTLCLIMCLLLLISAVPFSAAAGEVYSIALSENATADDRSAADTLRLYLARILPCEPVIGEAADQADFIIGGEPENAANITAGGYSITRRDGGAVYIKGVGGRGALNGVYTFLQEYCGCRWYAPEETVLPKTDALSLPDNINITYSPYFEYTATDWRSAFDNEFALANGLTSIGGYTGGYIYGFCHTLSTRFCSRDKYFDEHPEYFALHDGKRTPNQLCLTNPDTLRVVTDEVLEILQSYLYDPNADLQIISITQDDNSEFCECPACKALDKENGSHAGTNVTFANAVADAVKEAGYDNVAIDTFAYSYTRKTPTKVVPRDNVIIRLCDIECCFCHTLDDPKCKENVDFMQDLHDWGEICKRIYIWDYTTNYWETPCIYPDFGVIQRNMQIFYENNAKGIFEEGEPALDDNAEFGELRGYLLTRLMKDPYLDFDAEMRGFLKAYYGDAWEPIYRFLERVTKKAGASYLSHLGVFPDSTDTLTRFNASDVEYSDAQWKEAKEKAQGTKYFDRVERSELCWRFWKSENRRAEFSPLRTTLYMRMRAREELYNDLLRMGITYMNHTRRDREFTECMSLILLRCPGKWCKLYEEPFWFAIEPVVLKLYNLMGRIYNK
ncbi:MAG: DUF4838 domain-containing protein [Clostridiales bacterium]|nr:DUF4838 domain-containing protein [Clostridiales bacterium]